MPLSLWKETPSSAEMDAGAESLDSGPALTDLTIKCCHTRTEAVYSAGPGCQRNPVT